MSLADQFREISQLNPVILQSISDRLADFCDRRHWHELGETLCELFHHPDLRGWLIRIFQTTAIHCADNIDPFHYADVVLVTSEEFATPAESIDFLNGVKSRRPFNNTSQPTDLLCLRIVTLQTAMGDFEVALKLLLEIGARINDQTALSVRSAFHRAQSSLDLARNDLDAFYENAFLYLSTAGVKHDPELAYELCRAALLAERVCSFGELAAHPILNSLENTEHAWLCQLIIMLERGDSKSVDDFEREFVPLICQSEVFGPCLEEIREKVAIAVFLQLIFERDYRSRVLSFAEIANRCHIEIDQVEFLVLKAMSTEIIRGIVDEVEQLVAVTWCKPKKLDEERLKHLKAQIDAWVVIVHQQQVKVKETSQPVIGF
jgi:26S proteasome regulatory subunit N9